MLYHLLFFCWNLVVPKYNLVRNKKLYELAMGRPKENNNYVASRKKSPDLNELILNKGLCSQTIKYCLASPPPGTAPIFG